MEENLELQETLSQEETIIGEPSMNIENEFIEDLPNIEESSMFQIWVDENGYYTDVNTNTLVEVKEMPSINNIKELFLHKYNPETKLLELDETKLEQFKKEQFKGLVIDKLQELSNKCQEAITNGIELNGEHFSYTLTDQNNLKNAFQLSMQTGLSVPYHSNNNTCRLYSKDEISNIFFAQEKNVSHHTTYFNQLKQYILTLTSIDDIKDIEYGQELTGIYLETYEDIIAQSSLITNIFLSNQQ